MAAYKSFTFNSMNSLAYGIYITGEPVYNAPARSVEKITIPGRNGDLLMDQGRFENIEVKYPAGTFAETQTDFADALAAIRDFLGALHGYFRLTDDYNPDEYRLASFKNGLNVSPVPFQRAGEFDLVFDCKPQRFLTSGEQVTTLTASGTITNPTPYDAQPLLVVTGTGNLTVNGVQIAISKTPTTIDCEAMEAYNGTTSRNGDIVLTPNRFPVLQEGSNTITLGAGITKVQITPRWWRI